MAASENLDARTLARVALASALVVIAGAAIVFESTENLGRTIRGYMLLDSPENPDGPLPASEVSALHRAARAILREGGTS